MKRDSREFGVVLEIAALVVAALLVVAPAAAQQVTGVPGSPSATDSTIDGKQLPPPPAKFGGVIKESAKDLETLLASRQ